MNTRFSLKRLVYFLPLIISVLAPVFVILKSGFSYLGIAVSLSTLATMIYVVRKDKTKYDTALYLSLLILSLFIVLRTNPLLIFLNIVASFFLGSILAARSKDFAFLNSMLLPLRLLLETIKQKPNYEQYSGKKISSGVTKLFSSFEYLLSLAITIVLLLIIIPILASANPFFDSLVQNVISSLRIGNILEYLFGDNIPLHIARFIFFLILFALLPRLYSFLKEGNFIPSLSFPLTKLRLFLPKVTVAFVIIVFFVTQIQLYTAGAELLQEMGYTNSQQTREVFGQLAVVSVIIFFLIYNDKAGKKRDRVLSSILLTEGLFLTGMAFKSVFDYSSLFGFTQKRLYGFSAVLWLSVVYISFAYVYLKNLNPPLFVRGVILWTAALLIGINVANFDYLIAHVRPAHVGDGPDYLYIAYNTSSDAQAYEMLVDNFYKENNVQEHNYMMFITYRIRQLQDKYANGVDIRSFNLSEYQEYLKVKDVNTHEIEAELQKQLPLQPIPARPR
ncbi:DUF4173 domain-containing protein [Candidatus Roizmanbacteria bacterium]|nr:MAG: DUF4173 domain-containing protein [Candidatus Roizmanbacteria bacterium]